MQLGSLLVYFGGFRYCQKKIFFLVNLDLQVWVGKFEYSYLFINLDVRVCFRERLGGGGGGRKKNKNKLFLCSG